MIHFKRVNQGQWDLKFRNTYTINNQIKIYLMHIKIKEKVHLKLELSHNQNNQVKEVVNGLNIYKIMEDFFGRLFKILK